jgi:uncharacterized protein YfiM (DUF2279 family)
LVGHRCGAAPRQCTGPARHLITSRWLDLSLGKDNDGLTFSPSGASANNQPAASFRCISACAGPVLEELTWGAVMLTAAILSAVLSTSPPNPWLGEDKIWHAGVSAAAFSFTLALQNPTSETILKAKIAAGAFALSLGLAKEISDSRTPGNRFSHEDLVWDAVGIGIVWGGVELFQALRRQPAPARVGLIQW